MKRSGSKNDLQRVFQVKVQLFSHDSIENKTLLTKLETSNTMRVYIRAFSEVVVRSDANCFQK